MCLLRIAVTIAIVFPVQRTRRSSTRRQRAVYLSEVPTTATRQLFPKCPYPKSKLISTVKGIFIPGIFRYKEDLFFEVRIHPHPKGRGRGLSTPNFGVPFYLCVHPLLQNYQIDVVTYVERGQVFGVSHASHPKRAEFQGFPVLEAFLYLCLHPLTQNDQIWHGDACGKGRVFGSHTCHGICTNASCGSISSSSYLIKTDKPVLNIRK